MSLRLGALGRREPFGSAMGHTSSRLQPLRAKDRSGEPAWKLEPLPGFEPIARFVDEPIAIVPNATPARVSPGPLSGRHLAVGDVRPSPETPPARIGPSWIILNVEPAPARPSGFPTVGERIGMPSRCVCITLAALSVALQGIAQASGSASGSASSSSAPAPDVIARSVVAAEEAASRQDWAAVKSLLGPIVTERTLHGRLWHLLGRAYYNTGDFGRALPVYRRVFELRQGTPSSAAYTVAVCHARLGEPDRALEWLERAVTLGFRYMDDPWTEEAFTGLRTDPRFSRLFWRKGSVPPSREEGWRLDLDVLSAEVKRKAVHPFVTRERDGIEWGARLTEREFDAAVAGLKSRIGELTDARLGVEIQRLLREVGDGHTGAFAEEGPAALPLTLPLLTFDFEDGMHVVAAARARAALLGARVVAIDGKPLQQIVTALSDLISRDNEQWVRQVLPYRLRNTSLLHALGLIRRADEVTVTLVDESGRRLEAALRATNRDTNIWNTQPAPAEWITFHQHRGVEPPMPLRRMGDRYWFEHLAGKRAVYFQYNRVLNKDGGEPLDRFARRLDEFIRGNGVEKLIVDLRWNNGGDTFLNEEVLHALMRNPRIDKPGRFVVIIGRRTFSAAMNAAVSFERHMKPIFVGEPTGGKPSSPGDEVWETLPYSGITFNVSDVLWQGGWPYDHRPWLAPHVHVPPRFEDYRAGRDPALEAALAIRTTDGDR